MPLSLRRGTVTAISERHEGLVRAEVDGAPCVAYPRLTGPVALGDEVLVNTQARDLALGSGGFDVVYANLTRGVGRAAAEGAHVMKLPYTPGQFAARHAEEDGELAESLDGMPVVCCSLHSQVVPVCAALAGLRVAYLQLPGGALPVSLSDAVRALNIVSVAVGACIDGDVACVSIASALAWAKAQGFDAAVCSIGPGIVGTGTALGHGGLAAAEAANAASALGGRPVVAARVSEADERERHRGLSHHTEAVLRLCLGDVVVGEDGAGWREACEGLPLSHMGRGPDDDPAFFAAAFAAGKLARELLGTVPNFGTVPKRTVYDGKLFDVTVEEWNGREREIVEHPGAVCIVPVDRDGYVTLVRQLREATGGELLEIPAGTREPGEEPLQTARRELQEETGLTGGEWREVTAFWTTPGFTRERMTLFFAEGVEPGEASPEEDESFELVRWPVTEIESRLGEIEDAKSLVGLLLYLHR